MQNTDYSLKLAAENNVASSPAYFKIIIVFNEVNAAVDIKRAHLQRTGL